MIEEGLPEGKYRLEIYECIKSVIKRDLTIAEHKYLSNLLKSYVNTVRETKTIITKQEPIEHHWICDNCATNTVMSKRVPGSVKVKTMKTRARKNKEKFDEKAGS